MKEIKNSPELDKKLAEHIPEDINQKLENLKSLWIDPELFKWFHDRIMHLIEENPEAQDIISWELEKTTISIEHANNDYQRKFREAFD